MAKGKPKKIESTILYCSFCGKSQHDVRKLVAGPVVFICDECTELCSEIMDEEEKYKETELPNNKKSVTFDVQLDQRLSELEIKFIPDFFHALEKAIPSTRINIISIKPDRRPPFGQAIRVEVIAPTSYEAEALKTRVRELSSALYIEQQRHLAEANAREKLEEKLKETREQLLEALMPKLRAIRPFHGIEKLNMLVVFFDLVGFSRLESREREKVVEFLRSIGGFLFKRSDASFVNMWGDGVVCAFRDITAGLTCACNFISHLGLHGYEARGGGAWGVVKLSYNETTERFDIDGDSVNLGARLEPLAHPGEILIAEELFYHPELKKDDFLLRERICKLQKSTGTKSAGEELVAYSVQLARNFSAIE